MKARSKPREIEVREFLLTEELPPGVEFHVGGWVVFNKLHNSFIGIKPGDFVRVDNEDDRYPIDRKTFFKTYEIIE
jgi:hypothetical protein